MRVIRHNDTGFASTLAALLKRARFDPAVEQAAADILVAVRQRGDAAVAELLHRFDGVTLTPAEFAVTPAEFAAAAHQVAPADRRTIRAAHRQIADFARRQKRRDWSCRPRPGVTLGERFTPLDRVGVYVPGGTAPLVSTVLHTTTLAKVAGVREIVMVTPPRTAGAVHPAVLYAAQVAGATQVLKLGGVYAVGALAYGTESIRPVEKIVGPGNAYVTAAKRQVYGDVALDLVAGPSEILIIADDTANPRFIAADMLSQAEHGSGREQVYLITTHEPLVAAVQAELARQAAQLPRQACVQTVLDNGAFMIVVPNLAEAAAVASAIAPEHLEIMVHEPRRWLKKVRHAGAVFIGAWTPECAGDFVAGPSHVLPTGGTARMFSGLTSDDFRKRSSIISFTRADLQNALPVSEAFGRVEGLDAHARSARIRFEKA